MQKHVVHFLPPLCHAVCVIQMDSDMHCLNHVVISMEPIEKVASSHKPCWH